jgi:formylglycine-generating enzyme
MKTSKLKYLYLSIIISVFVVNTIAISLVHAAQTIPGVQRLEDGIAAYGHGEYEEAIFELEMAKIQISEDDKESLWKIHFYLGLSYCLKGDNDDTKKEFINAKEIFNKKLPDRNTYSPKIVKQFKDALAPVWPDIEMVFIKGDCYKMGVRSEGLFRNQGQKDEKPVHKVCIDDFYMGKYEVTQGQWEDVMGSNPAKFKNGNNYPVEQVSWDDVQGFLKKLNNKIGKTFRLPTEAEWEYAARSGGKREKYAGFTNKSDMYKYANFCDTNCPADEWRTKSQNDGYRYTSPVGNYKSNELGLYDMTGNVWEWCQDIYSEEAYSNHKRNNPIYVKSGPNRVFRGGSWYNLPKDMRASNRYYKTTNFRDDSVGFRLVRTVD